MKSRSRSSSKIQPSRRVQTARYTKTTRTADTGGIHNRRDKRFPMAKARGVAPGSATENDSQDAELRVDSSHADEQKAWQEAVMLWLSWNSTYEKLTAKMYRPGTDQRKIEALMDEMDQLRTRAIDLSEELIRAV